MGKTFARDWRNYCAAYSVLDNGEGGGLLHGVESGEGPRSRWIPRSS